MTMKYALLIFESLDGYTGMTEDERSEVSGEYAAIGRDERVLGGAQLQPVTTATTVRVRGGRALTTDGPFADTKEVFGGYYLVDAENLDEALEIAGRVPAARLGGAVEVRPLAMVTP
jgi:hypothetical protein